MQAWRTAIKPAGLVLRAAGVALMFGAASCGGRRPAEVDLGTAEALARAQSELVPVRLIVHPLSRIGVDAAGRPALLLHIELRDRFEQNTRSLGRLRVRVRGWGPDGTGGGEGAEAAAAPDAGDASAEAGPGRSLVWDVDLRDPERNALLFDDLITRTYVVTLSGVPAGLAELSERRGAGGGSGGGGGGGGGPVVTATFTFPNPRDPAGPEQTLSDSARLGR